MKQIETSSPLSMSGFTTRYWRATKFSSSVVTVILFVPRVALLMLLWVPLLVWNFIAWVLFFWITLAWRAYRRGHRRDLRDSAFQRELLNK